MLKKLQLTFALVSLFFVLIGMFNVSFDSQPLITFFLGLTLLVMGIREIQQKQKLIGGVLLLVALYSLVVTTQGVLVN